MTEHHAGRSIEAGQTTHNRQVVGEVAVAMHLHKICENFADVIQCVRTLRMTGNFGNLPGRQIGVNVFGQLLALLLSWSISSEISTADSLCT